MWILDSQRKASVLEAQIYLTLTEARELRDALIKLIADPEASEHEHFGEGAEFSVSIVTQGKLARGGYTPLERRVLEVE
jgi:microcystin degradation protein MlrC